ncbi:MAG TPA: PP2C family protein-serine/threonine phosphatase [Candidatus Limnocylindrales bacterium]|nr:PP2C family protein-serine/threonine phosphatase [Candidatus Limnocylindrales bacterium]
MVAPLLAPFDVPGGGLALRVEDPAGDELGAAGVAGIGAATESVHEIRCGPAKASVGQVIARGDGPLVEAVAASLASSLATIASTVHEHRPGGEAAHRLEAELALSRRIQRSLIPLTPPDLRGFEVATHYEAAREVGGDFFDVFPVRDRAGRAGIVIADVTGKGIAAALLMAFSRPLIRAAIDHARDPVVALHRTNRILVDERRSSLFITALIGMLDLRTSVLRLANAGHEPPLVVPGDGRPVRFLSASGPLLGAFATLDLVPCDVQLAPGDLVLFYTDGVTDMRGPSGDRFGEERLLAVVDEARGGTARDLVDALVGAIASFQGEMAAADDVTIVGLRRSPRSRRSPGAAGR